MDCILVTGTITKNNSLDNNGIELAFAQESNNSIAITPRTKIKNGSIKDLSIGTKISMKVEDTPRGKLASTLIIK